MSKYAFLVEDNPYMRDKLTLLLMENAGVSIAGTADNPTSACSWLVANRSKWHIAIVDIFLVGGSGLTVLAALRVRDRKHRVVVLTNGATQEMRRHCDNLGADRVFDKTTELEDLVQFCRAL